MTLEDAQKIAAIIETVDGGCPCCVGGAVEDFRDQFPEIVWNYDESSGKVSVALAPIPA